MVLDLDMTFVIFYIIVQYLKGKHTKSLTKLYYLRKWISRNMSRLQWLSKIVCLTAISYFDLNFDWELSIFQNIYISNWYAVWANNKKEYKIKEM